MTLETKLGIGGLPIFLIRVLDGKHSWEVEGLPVPNQFGLQLFVHEKVNFNLNYSSKTQYVLTEQLTGMIVPGSESECAFRSIYLGFDQLRKHESKLGNMIKNAERRLGVLVDLPPATRNQLEMDIIQ